MAGVVDGVRRREPLIELGDAVHPRDRDQVVAAEPAAVAFHPALLMRPFLTGDAIERLETVVRSELLPAHRFDAVAAEQDALDGRAQVVVADLSMWDAAEAVEGVDVALQERLLPLRAEHPVHRPAREREPQREQETLDLLTE